MRSFSWQNQGIFGRFVIVGGVGFCVDGGILVLLHQYFGLGILVSRLFSFLVAGTTTWYLNRRLTFQTGLHTTQVKEERFLGRC